MPAEGEDAEDGEDLSFTTAGDVAEGWLPDADEPEQPEDAAREPPRDAGDDDEGSPKANLTPAEAEFTELVEQGRPEEAMLRLVQQFGSRLQDRSFEDDMSAVRHAVVHTSAGVERV